MKDRSQVFVLLGMLVLTAILVGAVVFETKWTGGDAPKKKARPVPRVSLVPADREPFETIDAAFVLIRPLDAARIGVASRFDLPLGSEHGALSYNAQPFRENRHLGDDLNGIGGWDSDLGDTVFAAGDGRVLFAGWPSDGWGNMVILGHRLADGRIVQTVYAHLMDIHVFVGDRVHRGQRVGTVGKGSGQYLAHLHFEIRDALSVNPGAGYDDGPLDRLSPEGFLAEHRGALDDLLSPAPVFEGEGGGERRNEDSAAPNPEESLLIDMKDAVESEGAVSGGAVGTATP